MSEEPIEVLAIAGSLRKASFNRALVEEARSVAPPRMNLSIADISEIPLYSGDIEAAGLPPAVTALRERIAAADAVLISTPEYNFSIAGVLKNVLDWVSRPDTTPTRGKPVAVMGAGGRLGTGRAQYHLRQVLGSLQMIPVAKPEVFVMGAPKQFDADGRLTDSAALDQIRQLLSELEQLVRRNSAALS